MASPLTLQPLPAAVTTSSGSSGTDRSAPPVTLGVTNDHTGNETAVGTSIAAFMI
jgi:hypothetical protein